jgi:hypothetical protein
LIEVRLQSGRRNQIRLQATLHGHTLVGEQRYISGLEAISESRERARASEPGERSGARGPRERTSRGAPGGRSPPDKTRFPRRTRRGGRLRSSTRPPARRGARR